MARKQRKKLMRNSTTGALINPKKASKPSPSELAKADAESSRRRCGPVPFIESNPTYREYVEAQVALIKAGKSDMSARQIADKLKQHYGYEGTDAPVNEYVLKFHGGMRKLRHG